MSKQPKTTAKQLSKKGGTSKKSSSPAPRHRSRSKKNVSKRHQQIPEDKELNAVQITPTELTFKYFQKLSAQHKEELFFYNPTETVITFKVKTTQPNFIKIMPPLGYLKPKGKLTMWVIVNRTPDGKPFPKCQLNILLAKTPKDLPPNPDFLWKSENRPKNPLRRGVKVSFVALKVPPLKEPKTPTENWVDKIKKIKDSDDSESEKSTSTKSDTSEKEESE